MALSPGKRAAKRIMELLDDDLDSLTDESRQQLFELAGRILAEAFDIYEGLARYTVVGQLFYEDGTYYDPEDPSADKVSLGSYQTEKQATDAARSLTVQGGTQFRSWVLPIHHKSPAAWFKDRAEDKRLKELEEETLWRHDHESTTTIGDQHADDGIDLMDGE